MYAAKLVPRLQFLCRGPRFAFARCCPRAAASSVTVHQHPSGTLYVLDMLPYVYKALHQTAAGSSHEESMQQEQQKRKWESGPTHDCMMMLLDLIHHKVAPPTHMAVVVDVPGPNWRHLKYPLYKAQRPEHPPQLMEEVSRVLSLVDALGIPVLAVPGVEADDVVGSLAARALMDGFDVVLVSPDKDFYQLLCPGLSVLHHTSSFATLYTAQDFEAEYQLPDPGMWVDVKALAGDSSDNIPGVKGVGQKTALQLVQQWGDVDSILHNMHQGGQQLEGKVKLRKAQAEMLCSEDGAAAARLAKQLITIVTDLKAPPVRQPWDKFRLQLPRDGGNLAVQRALQMQLNWTSAKLKELVNSFPATI